MSYKIAVVIITHNGEKWIQKCLESVLKSSVSVDVFVIDNASTDETALILNEFKNINFEISRENSGFGKANNIVLKKVINLGYNCFFLLNQDTWIEEDTIEKLIIQQKNNPAFGIVSPLHFDAAFEKLDLNFANYFSKKVQITQHLFEVPFVNAAAWLVSAACFTKVGLFEPFFSHYGEDRNFSDRAYFHGFKIGIVDNAKIVHDRTIIRKFEKDLQQSKYIILNTLININFSIYRSFFIALKQVFGLPKYFYNFYKFREFLIMQCNLILYFIKSIFNFTQINNIRRQSVRGKNGI